MKLFRRPGLNSRNVGMITRCLGDYALLGSYNGTVSCNFLRDTYSDKMRGSSTEQSSSPQLL